MPQAIINVIFIPVIMPVTPVNVSPVSNLNYWGCYALGKTN